MKLVSILVFLAACLMSQESFALELTGKEEFGATGELVTRLANDRRKALVTSTSVSLRDVVVTARTRLQGADEPLTRVSAEAKHVHDHRLGTFQMRIEGTHTSFFDEQRFDKDEVFVELTNRMQGLADHDFTAMGANSTLILQSEHMARTSNVWAHARREDTSLRLFATHVHDKAGESMSFGGVLTKHWSASQTISVDVTKQVALPDNTDPLTVTFRLAWKG